MMFDHFWPYQEALRGYVYSEASPSLIIIMFLAFDSYYSMAIHFYGHVCGDLVTSTSLLGSLRCLTVIYSDIMHSS